jgi:hypothetical protein
MGDSRFLKLIRAYCSWVWTGKFHILTVASILLTILYLTRVITFFPGTVAAVMTILGVLIILFQQLIDAREFAEFSPNTPRNWMRSRPAFKARIVSLEGASFATAGGKARLKISISPDAPLEQKIAFLLSQVSDLSDSIANLDDRLDGVYKEGMTVNQKLKDDLSALKHTTEAMVAGHVVGTYDIGMFAAIITLCGTIIQVFWL